MDGEDCSCRVPKPAPEMPLLRRAEPGTGRPTTSCECGCEWGWRRWCCSAPLWMCSSGGGSGEWCSCCCAAPSPCICTHSRHGFRCRPCTTTAGVTPTVTASMVPHTAAGLHAVEQHTLPGCGGLPAMAPCGRRRLPRRRTSGLRRQPSACPAAWCPGRCRRRQSAAAAGAAGAPTASPASQAASGGGGWCRCLTASACAPWWATWVQCIWQQFSEAD
jgi:hypothetical protein